MSQPQSIGVMPADDITILGSGTGRRVTIGIPPDQAFNDGVVDVVWSPNLSDDWITTHTSIYGEGTFVVDLPVRGARIGLRPSVDMAVTAWVSWE